MSRTRTATATATATASPAEGGARRRHGPASASRLALLTLAVPLLLAAACSGDGGEDGAAEGQTSTTAAGDGDAQAYIDAGAASLTADEELRLDQETATCISTAAVELVGADALARAGVSPQEFAEAETYDVLAVDIPDDAATRMSDALGSCDAAGAFTSFFADELGIDLPPEARACLDERVDRQAVHDAMANGFFAPSGEAAQANQAAFQDTLETALMDAVVACPPVVTAAFLAEAPGTVTPETEACVSGVVEANPDRVRAAFGGDTAAADELGTEIGSTCAHTLGA